MPPRRALKSEGRPGKDRTCGRRIATPRAASTHPARPRLSRRNRARSSRFCDSGPRGVVASNAANAKVPSTTIPAPMTMSRTVHPTVSLCCGASADFGSVKSRLPWDIYDGLTRDCLAVEPIHVTLQVRRVLSGREDLVLALFGRQISVVSVSGVEVIDPVEHEQPVGNAADELLQGVGTSRPARAVGEQGISGEQVRTEREAGRGRGCVLG